ncbi:MAG TPA: UvrD-helicase domain-containing protein [Bryobacteraceae bacterium]|nr:UvrD-helicase domain-containing protein [Bryobacteraceae bacterium]
MKEVRYTPAQLAAIDISRRREDACVVAGPGSGKTTVLVEHFRQLVEAGVDPLRILAITFTEKAAGNMRSKLAEAFRDDHAVRARLERAWVSTVHGFCARLLRENAVFAGIDPEFAVADERESWRLQQESIADALGAMLADHRAAMRKLIRGLSSYEFEGAVLSAYDAMRGAGVRVEDLAGFPIPAGATVAEIADAVRAIRREPLFSWNPTQRAQLDCALAGADSIVEAAGPLRALQAVEAFECNLNKCKRGNNAYNLLQRLKKQVEELQYSLLTDYYRAERETLFEVLRRFDATYRQRKRAAGLLDFSDLEEFTVRLLEAHPATCERVRAQFDHILMDEFQDTNGQQARLMRLVRSSGNFYAVGDINQSIFGFRHAEPEGFARYQADVGGHGGRLVELTDNFRSRAPVLRAVETISNPAAGVVARPLVARREFETPRAVCVEVASAADLAIEARWVARRIVELAREGFRMRDFAVLVRNTEVIPDFTAAFDEAALPFVVNRGKGFYDTREVNDLAHLLRVIANPRHEISLAAVLRSPLVGVSDEALLALKAMAADAGATQPVRTPNLGAQLMRLTPDAAADIAPSELHTLLAFRDRLRGWRARRQYVAFDRLLLEAMDDCGYRPEAGARGAANIEKFLAQAREASRKQSLDDFIDEIARVRDSDPREPDAPVDDIAEAVKIMTVHSAKGLEFPVVFVAALHKGVESNPPVVAFSRRYGLGARWRNPGKREREDKDDLFQHALREEWRTREQQESDRLLYVAMTRAEEHLVLSFSGQKNWARDVTGRLLLPLDQPCDLIVTRAAPDGKEWSLRVAVAAAAPELLKWSGEVARPQAPEEHLLDPPEQRGRHDTNATVTALSEFAACPRQYFLGSYVGFDGRVRKLPGADADLPANEVGTQVHELLAGAPVADPDPEALRLVGIAKQSALARRAAKASRVEREFAFFMALEDLVIRGQVDLWFEEAGELVIVDYKTDDVTPTQAHQRAPDYAFQLRLYAMAVERLAGRPVDRAWVYFLRPNVPVEVNLAPSLLDSPEQLVRDFQEAQASGIFPLNEGARCQRCAFYKDLCPAGTGSFANFPSSC